MCSASACLLSVVIPTRNGAHRLPAVLAALSSQLHSSASESTWEVVVVDNGSEDDTRRVVEAAAASEVWADSARLRYIYVKQPGVHHARCAGVAEAHGAWVAFLDDDTIPDETWISEVFSQTEQPDLGAFAGRVSCAFPDGSRSDRSGVLALCFVENRREQPHDYDPRRALLPPGAGLVVRREVWHEVVPAELPFVGRFGRYGIAGEDTLAVGLIAAAGWRVAHHPGLHLTHRVEQERLSDAKLQKLAFACGVARVIPRMFALSTLPATVSAVIILGYWLKDGWRLLIFRLLGKHRSARESGGGLELAFLRGSLHGLWIMRRERALGEIWRLSRVRFDALNSNPQPRPD